MARHPVQLLELAKRGAEIQLQDLLQELRYLVDLFPHLRDSVDENDLPVGFIIARDSGRLAAGPSTRVSSRRGMTERKASSERMKKQWAARRTATKD